MKLTFGEKSVIIKAAVERLGKQRDSNYCCVGFVREVYGIANIYVGLLWGMENPVELNIHPSLKANPPVGHLMFLRWKKARNERVWTHVVIVFPFDRVIHCSEFWGNKVVVTPMEKIWKTYTLAGE